MAWKWSYVQYKRYQQTPTHFIDPLELVSDFPKIHTIETEYGDGINMLGFVVFDDSIIDTIKESEYYIRAAKFLFDRLTPTQAVNRLNILYGAGRFSLDDDGRTVWDSKSPGDWDLEDIPRKVIDFGNLR